MKSGFLSTSVESFVFAAQEKCVGNRFWQGTITKVKIGTKCRVCREGNELTAHLTSFGSVLRQSIYWKLCQNYGLKVAYFWHK